MFLVWVLLVACCSCLFHPFKPVKAKSSLLSRNSLFLSSLSSLLSHLLIPTLTVVYMPPGNWEQLSFQPMLHGAPCNTVTVIPSTDHSLIQSHVNTFTFNWPFTHTLFCCCCWSLLYSAILRSQADSLCSHVILHEWIAFLIASFWISTEVVYLQRWHGWCHIKLLPSQRVLCTPCHFMQSHIYVRCMHV